MEVIVKNKTGETNAKVGVDISMNVPYFSWHGFVDKNELVEACMLLEKFVSENKATSYLSDNREATGYFDEMPEWTAKNFIPKLKNIGNYPSCHCFSR